MAFHFKDTNHLTVHLYTVKMQCISWCRNDWYYIF